MRGFRGGIGAVLMIGAMSMLGMGMAVPSSAGYELVLGEATLQPVRSKQKRSYSANATVKCRNRWKAEGPKRRSNRLHISRRVRRKHRRAR